jgi:hypothetical protein
MLVAMLELVGGLGITVLGVGIIVFRKRIARWNTERSSPIGLGTAGSPAGQIVSGSFFLVAGVSAAIHGVVAICVGM